MVGVVAHLRGQIERDAQAVDALGQEVAIAGVGFGGGSKSGILPHRPEPAAIHRRLDATGVRKFTREAEIAHRNQVRL